MFDLYNLPSRASEDGPDLDESIVYVTVCKSCGWEDKKAHADAADCMVDKCPECNSEYLVDTTQFREYAR